MGFRWIATVVGLLLIRSYLHVSFRKALTCAQPCSRRLQTVCQLCSRRSDGLVDVGNSLFVRLLNNIGEVGRSEWNAVLGSCDADGLMTGDDDADAAVAGSTQASSGVDSLSAVCPFLHYDWIQALEESGCASTRAGWQPLHMLVYYRAGDYSSPLEMGDSSSLEMVAAMPLYVKYHSQGEFIFDQSWAEYARSALGVRYYPKLLSAIPFTPATGPRLVIKPSSTHRGPAICSAVIPFLQQLCRSNDIDSVNANFLPSAECHAFLGHQWLLRETVQYRWQNAHPAGNRTYADFDDYLSCFQSKRRIKIKAERRKVYADQKIRIEVVRGDAALADEQFYADMFRLYATTVEKMWGSQYLTHDFFSLLAQTPALFRRHLLFVVAYDESDRLVAGTINLISATHFYGRYWGAFKQFDSLHFEVCYYKAIEYCIAHNLSYMEPGAGGGEFKYLRGFDPYVVSSVHWFRSPRLQAAVGDFLAEERTHNQALAEYLIQNSAVSKKT